MDDRPPRTPPTPPTARKPALGELGVLIEAGHGEPERLTMLGTPRNGRVRVREWSSHNWSGAPDEREISTDEAYAIFRRAYDARRRMNVALMEIRSWLDGRAR